MTNRPKSYNLRGMSCNTELVLQWRIDRSRGKSYAGLPADFKIFFQRYSQVFDTIWPEFQVFKNIFQDPDGVYYNAAIGKNMKIAKYMNHSF